MSADANLEGNLIACNDEKGSVRKEALATAMFGDAKLPCLCRD